MHTFRNILSALTHKRASHNARAVSVDTLRARARFRHSMPGELGLTAAARLYGVGR